MEPSPPRFRLSLRVKLTLLIETCIIVLVTIMGLTNILREKDALESELRKRGLALASDLAKFTARPLLNNDLPSLRRFVNHSMEQEYVRYAMVLAPGGKVVMHSDLSEVGKHYEDPLSVTALHSSVPGCTDVHVSSAEELHCDIYAPIRAGDVTLGTVRLGYSHMAMEQQLEHARNQIFLIALLTTVAGGVISYFVASYISSPIRKITVATRRVSEGWLDTRINLSRSDEIGSLAGAFNRMTEVLRETTVSKDSFDDIIRSMKDTLVVVDPDSRIRIVNRAACELLEYQASELMGKDVGVILPRDGASPEGQVCRDTMAGSSPAGREMEYLTRSGKRVPVDFSAAVLRNKDGNVEGAVCIARDITERRQAEKALRDSEMLLHHLYSQLLTTQEEERRRLAGELHDELGQSLMVLNLRLRSIRDGLEAGQDHLVRECDAMHAYIREVAENVRRLALDLSPSILKDLGLWAAIRRLVESFGEHSGIDCSLDLAETGSFLSREEEITIYRMIQESLTNVAKHAEARRVAVSVCREGDSVLFRIEDDGKGFEVEEALRGDPGKTGLGLPSLNERARILGGFMKVRSRKGSGTTITFAVPLEKKGCVT